MHKAIAVMITLFALWLFQRVSINAELRPMSRRSRGMPRW